MIMTALLLLRHNLCSILCLQNLSKVDVNVDIDDVDVKVYLGVEVLLVVGQLGHQVSAPVFAQVSALRRSPPAKRCLRFLKRHMMRVQVVIICTSLLPATFCLGAPEGTTWQISFPCYQTDICIL